VVDCWLSQTLVPQLVSSSKDSSEAMATILLMVAVSMSKARFIAVMTPKFEED
jgi:hypothetical protein